MPYINTGYARKRTLTVTKGGYSQSYDIRSAFPPESPVYTALTDTEFAQLSDADYERRRSDFIDYVYSCENGLQSDCPDLTNGSVVYDPDHCPIS